VPRRGAKRRGPHLHKRGGAAEVTTQHNRAAAGQQYTQKAARRESGEQHVG